MDFDQLRDFIANQMRMSHIYQPVVPHCRKDRNQDIKP